MQGAGFDGYESHQVVPLGLIPVETYALPPAASRPATGPLICLICVNLRLNSVSESRASCSGTPMRGALHASHCDGGLTVMMFGTPLERRRSLKNVTSVFNSVSSAA